MAYTPHAFSCHSTTHSLRWPAGSNVVSVAEHVVMMMLTLVRNYIPAYTQIINGEWDVAQIAQR
jgi:lactate dehydrogenase-like 2-hydroxyacid dehydrogenase